MNALDDNDAALRAANAALARRRAIRRGDQGSPIEPITFGPLMQCGHCDVPLSDITRSHIIGVCQRCLEELVAREQDYKRRRDAKLAKEASRAGWGAMGTIVPWVLLAMAGAMLLGWLGSNAAWAIGKWWGQ